MIYPAIKIIQKELSYNIPAVIRNITKVLDNNEQTDDIIISLVNIEEDLTHRNNDDRSYSGTIHKNPTIHLNLTLLFSYVGDGYELGLQKIQQVIKFFHRKPFFNHSNTTDLDSPIEKIIFEMISLNLEQLHQLWSMLGGKYYPSVVYLIRLVVNDADNEGPS
ncbi:MAG: DUF4255 domain-containing protein [Bacteroidota bacterium]